MFEKLKEALSENNDTARCADLLGAIAALSRYIFPSWCEKEGIPSHEPEAYLRFGKEFGWLPLAGLLLDKIGPEGSNLCWLHFGIEVRAALREIIAQAPFASHALVQSLICELDTGRASPASPGISDAEVVGEIKILRPQNEAWFVKELGLDPNSVGAEGRRFKASLEPVINPSRTISVPKGIMDVINKIHEARATLREKLGRAPSNEEIAEASGIKPEAVEQFMQLVMASRNEEQSEKTR